MYKQIIYILILSLVIIFTLPYCQTGLHYLLQAHGWIIHVLSQVFAGGQIGRMIKSLIAILLIPLVIGGIVASVYWLFKRSTFPYTEHVIWVMWVILMTSIICVQG